MIDITKNGPALSSEDMHLKVIDETELIVYRDTDGKIDETKSIFNDAPPPSTAATTLPPQSYPYALRRTKPYTYLMPRVNE